MTVAPFIPGQYSALANSERFVAMRAQMDDLARQMSTGKRAATYGALGGDRRISIDVRAKLAAIGAWDKTIEQGNLRLTMMNQSSENFAKLALDTKGDIRPGSYMLGATGQTTGQILATERLKQSIDALNAELNGQYLFSGRTSDVKPVETFDLILNGDGAGRAGVRQLISERKQADAGAAGLGRLAVANAGATTTLSEEAANPPYGFKIAGATFTGNGVTPTYTAGPPADVSVAVTGTPNAGDTLSLTLTLPDGSQETLTLAARTATGAGTTEDSFVIGATPAATAANIAASLTAALTRETQTSLASASAIVAAQDFFNGTAANPPLRVPGPPYNTAVAAPAPGTAANTVIWYRGDADTAVAARNTATLQIDKAQTVGVGARANEEAYRIGMAQFATLAAETFSASDANAARHYDALVSRIRDNLAFGGGVQKPEEVSIELASAKTALGTAQERHDAASIYLQDALGKVEDASQEEVAAMMLTLQTRLQASYQTTAMLSQLSLTNYL